ncbi:hypothetical protein ACFQ6B_23660 [Streptomyces wedmorensis]|uniref:Uncharacterized protein n=1 Tax=Streptomyces wedmorensis TaxID=43759 RepID=A0ABW6J9N5_STRWE
MSTPTIKPIEVGQTYRPTPYNAARLPADRITVTRVWTPDGQSKQSIAYDIATVDYRNRPTTYSSAMRESAFRLSYVLDVPEPDAEPPADVVARAVALLDSLDSVTYAIVRPDTPTNLAVAGRTRGMDVAHGVEGLRSMADAMSIREAQRRMADATVPGLPDLFARAETVDAVKCPSGCACRPVSVEVTGTVDQAAVARTIEQVLGPSRATREQQRATAKAQVLREVADGLEARNADCKISINCQRCSARAAETARLRRAATELEAAASAAGCTCGVPTDPTAVHRTDAPCYVKDTDQ